MLDYRLHNWGRAMRAHRSTGSCGSIEKNYRSPQRNHWEEPVSASAPRIDTDDAWIVEAAWSTLRLPHRIILRAHYCLRLRPTICKRMLQRSAKIRVADYQAELMLAQEAIRSALERDMRQNRNMVRRIVQKTLALVVGVGYKAGKFDPG